LSYDLHKTIMDCGGKQSATPLSQARNIVVGSSVPRPHESAVAAAPCQRSPRLGRALQTIIFQVIQV
jgi:hypothetical protein